MSNTFFLIRLDETGSDEFKLELSLLDGSERRILCSGKGTASAFDMVVTERHIIWSDWSNMVVWRVPKNNPVGACKMERISSFTSRPNGLAYEAKPMDPESCKVTHVTVQSLPEATATPPVSAVSEPFDGCHNFCLNNATCAIVYPERPVCHCRPGFSGSRCESDVCANFCMNQGVCTVNAFGNPVCACASDFGGQRCHVPTLAVQATSSVAACAPSPRHQYILVSLIISTLLFLLSGSCCVFLAFKNHRTNSKLKEYLAKDKESPVNGPTVVKKRSKSRTFSGSRMKPSRNLLVDDANGMCGGDNGGVVIDLEDCCKMTLCDTVIDK